MYNEQADLKQFKININSSNTIEEIEIIILRIKAYIQNNNQLQTIVNNKITECNTLKKSLKYKLLARYLCGGYGYYMISKEILDAERYIYLNWWKNINSNNPDGLANLYLIPEPQAQHFEKYKNKKIITKDMCYPLFSFFKSFLAKHSSCLNIYMLYQELDTAKKQTNSNFYLQYLKAISNGTLSFLINVINPNSYEYYKSIFQPKKQIIDIINSNTNANDLIKIISSIINNEKISLNQLSNIIMQTEDTTKNRLRTLRRIFQKQNGELETVKNCVKEYSFTLSDFTC